MDDTKLEETLDILASGEVCPGDKYSVGGLCVWLAGGGSHTRLSVDSFVDTDAASSGVLGASVIVAHAPEELPAPNAIAVSSIWSDSNVGLY